MSVAMMVFNGTVVKPLVVQCVVFFIVFLRRSVNSSDVCGECYLRDGPTRVLLAGTCRLRRNISQSAKIQATCALSMAASEHHVSVTGAAEGLGMQSLLSDLALKAEVIMWMDSNAAKARASRRCLETTSCVGVSVHDFGK